MENGNQKTKSHKISHLLHNIIAPSRAIIRKMDEDNVTSPPSPGASASSRPSKQNKERDHSPKAKERRSRSRGHSPTVPGAFADVNKKRRSSDKPGAAVPSSNVVEDIEEQRNSGNINGKRNSGKPGAVPSSNRLERQKERGRSSLNKPGTTTVSMIGLTTTTDERYKGKSSARYSKAGRKSNASSSSRSRSPRRSTTTSEEDHSIPVATAPEQAPDNVVSSSTKDMETGAASEIANRQATEQALRDMGRENGLLRAELHRVKEEHKAFRRSIVRRSKVCFGLTLAAAVIVTLVVVFLTGDNKVGSIDDEGTFRTSPTVNAMLVTLVPSETPSQQPSNSPIATTENPTISPSLQPTNPSTPGGPSALPTRTSFLTESPTLAPILEESTMPTQLPTAVPTLAPTPVPSLGPTSRPSQFPTPGPTPLPTPGPTTSPTPAPTLAPSTTPTLVPSALPTTTLQPSETPSSAPTSKRMALAATLSIFAPFDGNKAKALDWLVTDTWEPPSSATEELSLSLLEERFALAVFYYATNGDGGTWTNTSGWLTSANACSWFGVVVCNGRGSVTKLNTSFPTENFGLVGDVPYEIVGLRNLQSLVLGRNSDMSGTIPSFLTALTKLKVLNMGDTGRTGSIPSELWTMTNMEVFWLFGNYLTGTIPSGISAVTRLFTFQFAYNELTGSIPDEFGGMSILKHFRVQENYLNGTIPTLPQNLTRCDLAREDRWANGPFTTKNEGNCFTNSSNAPSNCDLTANCS